MIVKKLKEVGRTLLKIPKKKSPVVEFRSYAQAGEDKVIEFLFHSMATSKISYLEIGTNNPIQHNNTYLFYRKGCRGVCVEPNPTLIPTIKKARPEDICLNVGVARQKADALDFHIFDERDEAKGLSTFSKEEAHHVESTTGIKVARVERIPVITINEILEKYFVEKAPDFLSIDVEGLDLDILQSIDFTTCRPIAICVETVRFSLSHNRIKRNDIIEFMVSKGYPVYADTGINSIFVDKNVFA